MDDVLTLSGILTRMIKAILIFMVFMSFVFYKTLGQQVAISAYMNKADAKDEWTELIVNADDVDMRGWTIRDNSNGNNWQVPVTFNSMPFWSHMRIGTIIMIWHRQTTSLGVNHPVDVNKTDGYIELYAFDPVYFTGGDLTNTLNLSQTADIIQLRDASGAHIHALGHGSPALGSITALPDPKLNHLNGSVADGDAIYVCPGASLTDYGTNLPNSGTIYTSKNNSTITFGLANTCLASATANKTYWRAIREPQISAQTVNPNTIIAGMPGSVSFSWAGAVDPYNADTTVRYLVLRNTINTFSNPTDGNSYVVGGIIGSATIVGIIMNSTITSFTDNTVMNGSAYYYRVYAFRYNQDDNGINGYALERGSAYNTTNFVSVLWPNSSPLPMELISFEGLFHANAVSLTWTTASETNNELFTVEKTRDGLNYEFVGTRKGAGNSSGVLHYGLLDKNTYDGISYYRLKQTDYDGKFSYSKLIAINRNKRDHFQYSIFPNPVQSELHLTLDTDYSTDLKYKVIDLRGAILISKEILAQPGTNLFNVSLNSLVRGIYFLQISGNDFQQNLKFIKE